MSPDRKPLGTPCEVCGEPAYRRRNVRHPINGKRKLMALCQAHAATVDRHGHPWYSKRVLTDAEIADMQREYDTGEVSMRDLAERYGVSAMTVHRAVAYGKPETCDDPGRIRPD